MLNVKPISIIHTKESSKRIYSIDIVVWVLSVSQYSNGLYAGKLRNQGSILGGARDFSLLHSIQTGCVSPALPSSWYQLPFLWE
jgi:hypothetical protein